MLKNKITFISGASSGIGKACAEEFAKAGSDLILCARRITRLNELADHLTKKYKVKVKVVELDVRSRSSVKSAADSLGGEWENIDILINNAGLSRGLEKIYEGNIDHWEEMIDTNIKGLLYVTRAVLPRMAEKSKGHIINIGSTAGHYVYPNGNVYCATKFAVNALTQAIRLDTYEKNIRVSTVDPGMVETEFSEVRFSGDKGRAKKVYEGISALTAEDIASAVLFCATRPPHVNISEMIVTPQAQATPFHVHRK
ncbi:MAG: SDR family NAD(P)-dependent oxidoreductase [Ignavibacteriaceae bacterium]